MSLPAQAYSNLLDMMLNNSDWASDWNRNIAILKNRLRTFKFTTTVTGNTGSPSTMTIQLQDSTGLVNIAEQFYLRVRVVNQSIGIGANNYACATSATVAAGAGTTLKESLTANKDIIVQSDVNGKVTLTLTCAVASRFAVLIGHTHLAPQFANYWNTLSILHS